MIDLAIIGKNPLSDSLLAHRAPIGRIRITMDKNARAILIAQSEDRLPVMLAALRAGKVVLCPPPIARTQSELDSLSEAATFGRGQLLSAGEIVHSEAGRHGLAAIRAPEFGPLRSLYLAIRHPRGGAGDVLEALGWEALDFITAALPAGISHARLNGASLFGPGRDTVVLLLRGPDDAVVTVELSRCLPPTIPAPEVEIDAIGAHQAVRIEPHASAVRIYTDRTITPAPWLDAPILAMLRAIEHAADHGGADALPHAARVLAAMTAIRQGSTFPDPSPQSRSPRSR